jgi:hypothetical protein
MFIYSENTGLMEMFGNEFMIAFPQYFDWLDNLFATTDERVLRNYLVYKFVSHQVRIIGDKHVCIYFAFKSPYLPFLRDIYKKTQKANNHLKEFPTDQGLCAARIMDNLPLLMGRVYADTSDLSRRDFDELNEMIGIVLSSWRGMIACKCYQLLYQSHTHTHVIQPYHGCRPTVKKWHTQR